MDRAIRMSGGGSDTSTPPLPPGSDGDEGEDLLTSNDLFGDMVDGPLPPAPRTGPSRTGPIRVQVSDPVTPGPFAAVADDEPESPPRESDTGEGTPTPRPGGRRGRRGLLSHRRARGGADLPPRGAGGRRRRGPPPPGRRAHRGPAVDHRSRHPERPRPGPRVRGRERDRGDGPRARAPEAGPCRLARALVAGRPLRALRARRPRGDRRDGRGLQGQADGGRGLREDRWR